MKKIKIIGAVLLGLAIVVGVLSLMSSVNYSEGNRVGIIQKFSKKGLFFKAYEGDLNLLGGDITMGQGEPWHFSVTNPVVIDNLDKAQTVGRRVKLTYEEKFFQFPWKGDTVYFVVGVEPLHDQNIAITPVK